MGRKSNSLVNDLRISSLSQILAATANPKRLEKCDWENLVNTLSWLMCNHAAYVCLACVAGTSLFFLVRFYIVYKVNLQRASFPFSPGASAHLQTFSLRPELKYTIMLMSVF